MGAQGWPWRSCPSLASRPPAPFLPLPLCPGPPSPFSASVYHCLWLPLLSSEQLCSERTEICCHLPPPRLFLHPLTRAEPPPPGQGRTQRRPQRTSPLKIIKNCPVPGPCQLTLSSLYPTFFSPLSPCSCSLGVHPPRRQGHGPRQPYFCHLPPHSPPPQPRGHGAQAVSPLSHLSASAARRMDRDLQKSWAKFLAPSLVLWNSLSRQNSPGSFLISLFLHSCLPLPLLFFFREAVPSHPYRGKSRALPLQLEEIRVVTQGCLASGGGICVNCPRGDPGGAGECTSGKPPLPGSPCGPAHVSCRWHGKDIMWCEVCLWHMKRSLEKSPVSLWG